VVLQPLDIPVHFCSVNEADFVTIRFVKSNYVYVGLKWTVPRTLFSCACAGVLVPAIVAHVITSIRQSALIPILRLSNRCTFHIMKVLFRVIYRIDLLKPYKMLSELLARCLSHKL
jgi:hypothetical protein